MLRMLMKVKRAYPTAKAIAGRVQELLAPHCEPGRCIIAGSVRRRQSMCGDIEIVCQPLTIPGQELDLFGEPLEAFRVDGFSDVVVDMFKGRVTVGDPTYGRYTSGLLAIKPAFGGGDMQVDIFTPQPSDFFRQLAIRTGSAEFSRMIATQWVSKGWRGTEDGLRRADECEQRGGKYYLKQGTTPTLPPIWNSEEEFFLWLGLQWAEPEIR